MKFSVSLTHQYQLPDVCHSVTNRSCF